MIEIVETIKKRRRKPQHIFCKLFRQNFYISRNISRESYLNEVKKVFGEEKANEIKGYFDGSITGKCINFNYIDKGKYLGKIIWIWTATDSIPILVHEIAHAASLTFENVGCEKTEELEAYYMGYLVREILGERGKQ